MTFFSFLLANLALGTQQPQPVPPGAAAASPLATVAVGAAEQLRATITLPNHTTLLFFPTLNSPAVRVVGLLPTGQVAWETNLRKAQVAEVAKKGLVDLRDRTLVSVKPLLLTSSGNTAYTLETVVDASPTLPLHTLVVQALDAEGHLSSRTFAVPAPEGKAERTVLTAFAEAGAVYAVAKVENRREQTAAFFLDRCDLGTGKLTHTPLPLTAPAAAVKHGDEFYRDWVFGGFRAGECYFYRAVKGTDPKADARNAPVEFDVKRIGTDGRELASFRTALQQHLPPGTFAQGGVSYPHYGQAHMPQLIESPQYADKFDAFDPTTGGNADFYLDEATGNCQFAGQYSPQVFDGRSTGGPSLGTFVQRYGPTGALVQAVNTPYAGLAGFKPGQLTAQPLGSILCNGYYAPDTHDLTLQYWTKDHFVVSSYDAQLRPRPLQFVAHPERKPREAFDSQIISWSGPSYLEGYANTTGASQPQLMLDALLASPLPLHQHIAQLVDGQLSAASQRKSQTVNEYTVIATGPGTALVLESAKAAGGKVGVYEVK